MPSLFPDMFTAYGMASMSAFAFAWVMWAVGRQHWQQGMAVAIASTLLFGVAYVLGALQIRLEVLALHIVCKLLINAAIGLFTVALARFDHSDATWRDLATVLLPVSGTLLLAAWLLPTDVTRFQQLHAVLCAVQTAFTLVVLLRMRSRIPGKGWRLVTGAAWLQLAVIVTVELSSRITAYANPMNQYSTLDILSVWALGLIVQLKLMAGCSGFLLMQRDRASLLEQGKAQLDPLTQLPNRAALVHNLQDAIADAAQLKQPLSLMVLDIDHFKSVNDSYGHLVGDSVIQSIARILQQQSRTGDFAARYGGEEFVVILPNTSAREAFHVAERLCQTVRKSPLPLPSGKLLHTTISIGVYAGAPTHGNSWKHLLSAADEAMYVAKRSGRDRVAMSATVHAMQPHAEAAMT